jgi:hypothetical protein
MITWWPATWSDATDLIVIGFGAGTVVVDGHAVVGVVVVGVDVVLVPPGRIVGSPPPEVVVVAPVVVVVAPPTVVVVPASDVVVLPLPGRIVGRPPEVVVVAGSDVVVAPAVVGVDGHGEAAVVVVAHAVVVVDGSVVATPVVVTPEVVVVAPAVVVVGCSVIGSDVGIGRPPAVVVEPATVVVVHTSAAPGAACVSADAARTASTLPPMTSGMTRPDRRLAVVPTNIRVLSPLGVVPRPDGHRQCAAPEGQGSSGPRYRLIKAHCRQAGRSHQIRVHTPMPRQTWKLRPPASV